MADSLSKVLEGYRPGYALPGAVYKDPAVYELEIRHIMLKSWHYVGHHSMVPERGDYFLFEMAGESVIVVRDGEGGVNAFMNVCRHRGSRICDATAGHESRFTCRYHGWTYGLDGSLKAAARMPPDFDRVEARAAPAARARVRGPHLRELRRRPAGLRGAERDLGPAVRPYGLDSARVAHRQNYPIRSNWKLAVENYCECYHCQPAHPEYSVGHGRALPDAECDAMLPEVMARAPEVGLTQHVIRRSWLDAPCLRPRIRLRPLSAAARSAVGQPRR